GDTDAIAPVSGKTRYAEAGRLSQHQARVKREEQNQKRSKERLMESKVEFRRKVKKSPCKTAN
ncbi:hypothetical protein M3677_17080, partial [Curtobacterium sp. P97]|nr:hypothetical protein [Curtobacterium sp. P97]